MLSIVFRQNAHNLPVRTTITEFTASRVRTYPLSGVGRQSHLTIDPGGHRVAKTAAVYVDFEYSRVLCEFMHAGRQQLQRIFLGDRQAIFESFDQASQVRFSVYCRPIVRDST